MHSTTRQVYCHHFLTMQEGLPALPFPGELGEKIFQEIGFPAWKIWGAEQTKLINEKRLNLGLLKDRMAVFEAMQAFLWHASKTKLLHTVKD